MRVRDRIRGQVFIDRATRMNDVPPQRTPLQLTNARRTDRRVRRSGDARTRSTPIRSTTRSRLPVGRRTASGTDQADPFDGGSPVLVCGAVVGSARRSSGTRSSGSAVRWRAIQRGQESPQRTRDRTRARRSRTRRVSWRRCSIAESVVAGAEAHPSSRCSPVRGRARRSSSTSDANAVDARDELPRRPDPVAPGVRRSVIRDGHTLVQRLDRDGSPGRRHRDHRGVAARCRRSTDGPVGRGR